MNISKHGSHGSHDFSAEMVADVLAAAEARGWPGGLPYATGRLTCAGESWWREQVATADDVVLNQLAVALDDVGGDV